MALRPPPPPGFVPYEPQQQIPASPVIRGTAAPRLPPPQTPTNAARDEVGLIGDRQRIENERLAAERTRLQLQQDRRTAADPAGDSPTEQRRIAGFYLRAARANDLYGQHQVAPRGVVGQSLADTFPRVANSMSSAERQQAEALQREFIAPILRYESGAAVPPAEFEDARARYFPQPGDGPEVIALKARLRANALESLQRSAGPAATGIDPTNPPADGVPPVGHSVTEGALSVAPAGGAAPPGSPPPPNDGITRTDPRESGLVAGVTQQPNQEIAGSAESGTMYAGPLSQRFVSEWQNAVNQGATREQLNALLQRQSEQLTQAYHMLAPLFPGISLGPQIPTSVPDDMWRMIEEGRRAGRMPNWGPNAIDPQPGSGMGRMLGDSGTAAVSNALDSASFGLPALVSEDFRNRLGNMREHHPIASTVGALVGGIVAPGGPRPGMSLLEQSGRSAAQGAAYGFNESGGDPENALVGGAIGLAAPGAFNLAGRVVRPVGNALLSPFRRTNVTPEMQAVAQAAEQEGVRVSPPVVDPRLRDRMMYLEASPGTGNIVREGAPATRVRNEAVGLETTRGDISNRVADLTAGGTAQEPGTMGGIVQNAGKRELNTVRGRLSRDYDRAEQMVQDVPIYGRELVSSIDAQIGELSRNPSRNAAVINYLNSVRRDFVDENGQLIPKSMRDMRELRTDLRGNLSHQNLTQTSAERRMTIALQAARRDVRRDLVDIHTLNPTSEMGQRARAGWELYRRTDVGWEQQARLQRQVLDHIIGPADNPKEGSAVIAQIRALAASGNAVEGSRLARMWQTMSKQEQRDTAATIAQHFGRKSEDDAFSPQNFITETARIQPSARRLMFGEEGAQSIANLRVLSRNLDGALKRLNNSRSGAVRNWGQFLRELRYGGGAGTLAGALGGGSMVASGTTGLALGAASAAIGTAVRKLSARSLMTPEMSRWLAGATRASTPSAIRQHIARLAVVERANPALTQEISGLRQALLNAVNDNGVSVSSAVASPDQAQGNNQNER